MTYGRRIVWNRALVGTLTIAVYAAGVWIMGYVFEAAILMARPDLPSELTTPIVVGVRTVAFICLMVGSAVTSFLKMNKDTILMGMGPYELRREIDLLSAALEEIEQARGGRKPEIVRVEKASAK